MEIFISYEYTNRMFVELLTPIMRKAGQDPLVINLQSQLGDEIYKRVGRALRDCDHAVVVLSEEYTASEWLEEELVALFMIEQLQKPNFILPVLIENCRIPTIIKGRKFADFRDVNYKEEGSQITDEQFSRLTGLIVPRVPRVFVVMPFGNDRLNRVYQSIVKPIIEKEFKFQALRIDENLGDDRLLSEQILANLEKSEIVLVDLTDERPNCYYEAGYAHALQKEIIFTVQGDSPIHFDLAGYRYIKWSDENNLAEELRKHLGVIRDKLAGGYGVAKPALI